MIAKVQSRNPNLAFILRLEDGLLNQFPIGVESPFGVDRRSPGYVLPSPSRDARFRHPWSEGKCIWKYSTLPALHFHAALRGWTAALILLPTVLMASRRS